MAFTVEDGTGVTNANAYVSIVDSEAYWADRGDTVWAGLTDAVQQAAIIKATDYIDARFGPRFRGTKLVTTQGLMFPRADLYDEDGNEIEYDNGLPVPFINAVCEYAYRARSADLWNEPELNRKGRLVVERSKVGPIEEDIRYVFNRDVSQIKPVPGADRLILKYCIPSGLVFR